MAYQIDRILDIPGHTGHIVRPNLEDRVNLHIVDRDSANRARLANICFSIGYHAEVYENLDELLYHSPRDGLLLLRENEETPRTTDYIAKVQAQLLSEMIWLPVVVIAKRLETRLVVEAIKAGAIDYLRADIEKNELEIVLRQLAEQAKECLRSRREQIQARRALATLSGREYQILDHLVDGYSNRAIAEELNISPRTVEIHRAKVMDKLGAGHVSDVVRMWIKANSATGQSGARIAA